MSHPYIHGIWLNGRPPAEELDIDEVAVWRAIRGDLSVALILNPAERAEAVRQLDELGHGAQRIAEVLGCTQRTVVRHRMRRRAAA